MSKLSPAKITLIRQDRKNSSMTQQEIADKHQVNVWTINKYTKDIKTSWKGKHTGVKSNNRGFTDSEIMRIKKLLSLGVKQVDICKEFNTTSSTISQINTGKIYSEVTA